MSSSIKLITAFLLIGSLKFARSDIPAAPDQPRCLLRGYPPKLLLLSSLRNDDNTTTYEAHYCHPSRKTKFCRNKSDFNKICTFNETIFELEPGVTITTNNDLLVKSTLFQCNMTWLIWNLYPNLINPSLPPKLKGNSLCMVISATNENGTNYSKRKCCSVVISTDQCKVFPNTVTVEAPKKGQISITLKAPADFSDSMSKVLEYRIRYTGNNESKFLYYKPFTSRPPRNPRQYSIIIKGLPPYTSYSIEISCYLLRPSQGYSAPIFIRTLPEAPYIPPIITGVQTVSRNNTMKTVELSWEHPPKSKRNGIISKSVVHYWIKRNLSSSSLFDHGITLTILGLSTQAFIEGLHINEDYFVAVNSCTVECSDQSAVYQIKREANDPFPTPQASTGNPFSTVTFVTVLVVVPLLVVAIVLVVWYFTRGRKGSKDKEPPFILPDNLEVSHVTPDDDNRSVDILGNDSSDYARPVSQRTFVESPNHKRASLLQNKHDEDDLDNKASSMEEILLC